MPSYLLGWLLRGCSQPTDSRYATSQATKYRKLGSFIDYNFVHHVILNYCLFQLVTSPKAKPPPQDVDTIKDGQGEEHMLKDSPSQLQGMYQIPNDNNMEPSNGVSSNHCITSASQSLQQKPGS